MPVLKEKDHCWGFTVCGEFKSYNTRSQARFWRDFFKNQPYSFKTITPIRKYVIVPGSR